MRGLLHMAALQKFDCYSCICHEQGADPGVKDGEGRTPLHHAVMHSHLAVVEALLDLGGPVLLLSKDILGCTPVHLAAVQNQVVRLLLSEPDASTSL